MMIKKRFLTMLLMVVVIQVFMPPFFVLAEDDLGPARTGANSLVPAGEARDQRPNDTFTLKNPLKVNSIGGLVQDFVTIFSYIVILFAVLMLIWVGLKFILARGNAEEMKKLKDWLLWIVVGVAVVIGARVIIQVVINTLSATGTIDQSVINSTQNALRGR